MNSPATPAERLSVTRLSSRPPRPLTGAELGTLRVVADALIPATGGNPSGSSVADFESGVHTALAILDRQFDDITAVLGNLAHIDSEDMYAHLRRFADAEPNRFYTPGFRRIKGVLGYSSCGSAGQGLETSAKTGNSLVTRFSRLRTVNQVKKEED